MLVVVELVVVVLIVRNWAYVTTYRLYLDDRTDSSERSLAVERFDVEGNRVMPQIVTRGAERLAFKAAIGQDSTVHVEVRPVGRISYTINWRDGSVFRTLARGTIDTVKELACPFPTGNGILEFVSDGAVAWVDLRIVRDLRVGPHLVVLTVLVLCSCAWQLQRGKRLTPQHGPGVKVAMVVASTSLAIVAAEVVLRAVGDMVPSGILTERHDLGEVTRDPRWEDSPRYGRRLRSHLETVNEWRDGDIVRMGYMPSTVGEGALHRFGFHTDAEGFRNAVTRERFDIAALGDSFTDAMTMAGEASWPAELERRLGVTVQNYGTAGFGPQQELLVLKDFVAVHRPHIVVLAFFAGNDLFDAEAFEEFVKSGGSTQRVLPGWPIKEIVSRADTWYVMSALRAGTAWLGKYENHAMAAEAPELPSALRLAEQAGPPSFDRGMFRVSVNGHVLRWALMPPYLNTLNFSDRELEARRGWKLTRTAISQMREVAGSIGAEFIVTFIPFKSQVYLPLIERAFSRDAVRGAFEHDLDGNGRPVNVDLMRANRLAQNRLMRRFCAEAGIPFLDTTDGLEGAVAAGENMYFPDDSHLNEQGEAVVAQLLAEFLRTRTALTGPP